MTAAETPSPSREHVRPTLKTIAGISGLAVQTVSRALGDAPDISAKTKERVRRIADEIGYVPNRAGVRLRTGKTNVVSLVLAAEHDVLSLTTRLVSSISERLRETPYHLVVTPDSPKDDPMKAVRYIVENGTADAIIINRIQPKDPRVAYLMERGFPFATHGRSEWCDNHAYFDYDNKVFGEVAVESLVASGRRRLLLLAPPQDQNYSQELIAGARLMASRLAVDLVLAEGMDSDRHRDDIRAFARATVLTDPAIDGLISASPNATMSAIAGIEAAGRKLGKDFDVASKETVPILELFRPEIKVVYEDIAMAGRFLAAAAVGAVRKAELSSLQYMDKPERL